MAVAVRSLSLPHVPLPTARPSPYRTSLSLLHVPLPGERVRVRGHRIHFSPISWATIAVSFKLRSLRPEGRKFKAAESYGSSGI
jgi:hypothetical protein